MNLNLIICTQVRQFLTQPIFNLVFSQFIEFNLQVSYINYISLHIINQELIMITALSQKKSNNIEQELTQQKLAFRQLTTVYEKVGNTRGENSKNLQKGYLANMFKMLVRSSSQDLVMGYWLSVLKIGPDYQRTQLGIGRQILVKAISKSCGLSEKQVRQKQIQCGDLGQVAQNSKTTQKTMDSFFTKKKAKIPLTIQKIFKSLYKISKAKGNSSNTQRQSILMNLLLQSVQQQAKFIVRWVQGNLKIAAGQKTMQKALITALFEQCYPVNKQTEQNFNDYQFAIKKAMAQYPNQQIIIKTLLQVKDNIEQLNKRCRLTPGIPCKPMLAKPTKNIASILTRFQGKKMTCEYKYDGLRGQVHYHQGKIQIYSRNLQNLTQSYPDIVQQIAKNLEKSEDMKISSFILDCQIVAVNQKTKQLFPFQVLSTRSRKATNLCDIEVHINLFAFDILYYNEPITHLTLEQRRVYLEKLQPIFSDFIQITEHRQLSDFDKIDHFLQDAIKFGTQGLMIKDLASQYTCSKRAWEWVKLKKDYIDGLGDTLDVVPIGAFYGIGKRKGVFGSYLLAIYNSDMELFQTICKIGTGFSDEVLQSAFEYFKDKIVLNCPNQYKISSNTEKVDVWLEPCAVWQIKGADFQLSPVYTCGIGDVDPNRGIGLRFPRLIKVRQDKKPTEASTNEFILDLYKQQAVVQNKNKEQDEDDFY